MSSGCGDYQAVCRIAVERGRQRMHRCDHVGVEWKRSDSVCCGHAMYPGIERFVQDYPAMGYEHLSFPDAYGCNERKVAHCQRVEGFGLPRVNSRRTAKPPEPYMCVEQNAQRDASKSSSSRTDSSGSNKQVALPRRRSHGFRAPAAFDVDEGWRRATTLPRRVIATARPVFSTPRMISRQRCLNSVTEMAILEL